MSELQIRQAEQTLRELAETFGRSSEIAEQFQRDGFRPELWDQLERIDQRKKELASNARFLAVHGGSEHDVFSIIAAAERCEREEDRLFIRAFWEDLGMPG